MTKRIIQILSGAMVVILLPGLAVAQPKVVAYRFEANPIITPDMLKDTDGENINGPSLIRVPDFIQNPLGKYYLYFSHHSGKYIRLAYADDILGPWKIYEDGTLKVEDCACSDIRKGPRNHIASPDVHIDYENQKIVMYFHCPVQLKKSERKDFAEFQVTMRSTSHNGLSFIADNEKLGDSYFRIFKWKDYYYGMARLGQLYRSKNGINNFEKGPNPFYQINQTAQLRHSAILIRDETLFVFYSRIGDVPERILVSTIHLTDDWNSWEPSEPETILESLFDYEGVNQPLTESKKGPLRTPGRQLRDPAIFEDNGKTYLLYTVAAELGIAISEILFDTQTDSR